MSILTIVLILAGLVVLFFFIIGLSVVFSGGSAAAYGCMIMFLPFLFPFMLIQRLFKWIKHLFKPRPDVQSAVSSLDESVAK